MCPPLAYTPLPVEGVIRSCPDDFVVDERAAFEPSHDGEHLLLRIEKRGLNTHAVATELARFYGVAPGDVSFAGMKDRHAVTRQWFSVLTPSDATTGDGDRLARGRVGATRAQTAARRTGRKCVSVSACAACVDDVHENCPNGSQHFAKWARRTISANNDSAETRRTWRAPKPGFVIDLGRWFRPFQKGLHLSTARALLFNAVLARRVDAGNWNSVIDGDVPLEALPTGPLWGRGRAPARDAALDIEATALAPYREWLDPLEHLGLTQERRGLVLRPLELEASIDGSTLELRFELPPGHYATALLRELATLRNASLEVAA